MLFPQNILCRGIRAGRLGVLMMSTWTLLAAVAFAVTQIPVGGKAALNQLGDNTRTGKDKLGAVASENKICSSIGIDLLKAGGNAADAVSLSH